MSQSHILLSAKLGLRWGTPSHLYLCPGCSDAGEQPNGAAGEYWRLKMLKELPLAMLFFCNTACGRGLSCDWAAALLPLAPNLEQPLSASRAGTYWQSLCSDPCRGFEWNESAPSVWAAGCSLNALLWNPGLAIRSIKWVGFEGSPPLLAVCCVSQVLHDAVGF